MNIRHNGTDTEEFEEVVSEGKVTIEVDNLSPFIIYTEKKIVEEPETPIIPKPDVPDNITPEVPDDSKPVIKPTPDTPIQTKPSQNQPQQNTVSTEDNNNLLLWGVLGIVGISIVIMSVKKTIRIKNK